MSRESRDAYYDGEDRNADLGSHDRPNSMEGDGLFHFWHPYSQMAKVCVQVDLGRHGITGVFAGMLPVRTIRWPDAKTPHHGDGSRP